MGDVYITTKVTNANGALRRTKTLYTANSGLTQYDKPTVGTTQVNNLGSVYLNLSNGVAWFTNANSIVTNWTEKMPLYVSDVIRIKGVYDSANALFAPNTQNATTVDISSRYLLDSGQGDNFYDFSALRLKPGATPPRGQVAVVFDRYAHSGTGYLSANSYPYTDYLNERIPLYKSGLNTLQYLRDSIDFRPYRADGTTGDPYLRTPLNTTVNVTSGGTLIQANVSNTSGNTLTPPLSVGSLIKIGNEQRTVNAVFNTAAISVSVPFFATATNQTIYYVTQNTAALTGSVIQRPTDPFVTDYEFYLPRIDKVVVTKDKTFKVLAGIPNQHPIEPSEDSENEMAIYKVYVPPFTPSLKSVVLQYIENRRYTMKDISKLDSRIQRIESYVNLKDAEAKLINDPPVSAKNPAIVKPIYGTLVDDFTDLTVTDQTYGGFAASIENGVLTCYKLITSLPLQVSTIGTSQICDKFITIPFTETALISQPLATLDGPEQVIPDTLSGNFSGYVTLSPESDYWYSVKLPPTYIDTTVYEQAVVQPIPVDPPVIAANTANTDVVVVSNGENVSGNTVLTVPVVTSSNTEANTTVDVSIDFSGVAIQSALYAAAMTSYYNTFLGLQAYGGYSVSSDPYLSSYGIWNSQLSSYLGRTGATGI
jgi:hypothetical protein